MTQAADLDALDLDDDERLLQEAAAGALGKAAAHRRFTARDADVADVPATMWALARDMGWPGLLVPEASGGQGLGLAAAAILAEEMGRQLFCAPFTTTAVLAVALANAAGAQDWREKLLPLIARGSAVIVLAAAPSAGSAGGLALSSDMQPRLTGIRDLVEYPSIATHVLALDLAQRDGRIEVIAAIIDNAGPGVQRQSLQAFDVTCPIARYRFADAPVCDGLVLRLSLDADGLDALLRPFHVVVAAELVGVARAALDRSLAHAKSRTQFGQPIGSFQAIKHRLADVLVQVESARLAVRDAACDEAGASAALAARILATDAALGATSAHVQVLGGMGFSWENEAHLYLKRARRLSALLADPTALRARVAARFIAATLAQGRAAS